MTVEELIIELEKMPKDLIVYISLGEGAETPDGVELYDNMVWITKYGN